MVDGGVIIVTVIVAIAVVAVFMLFEFGQVCKVALFHNLEINIDSRCNTAAAATQ